MFATIEFYIILAVIAAAIVAFAARPSAKGPAEEYLLAGRLSVSADDDGPELQLICGDDGTVTLLRRGVEGLRDDGAVSLAAKKIGNDIFLEERIVEGRGVFAPAQDAMFTLKFMPAGRYHIKYNSAKTGLFAAFPFHCTPGLRTTKILNR